MKLAIIITGITIAALICLQLISNTGDSKTEAVNIHPEMKANDTVTKNNDTVNLQISIDKENMEVKENKSNFKSSVLSMLRKPLKGYHLKNNTNDFTTEEKILFSGIYSGKIPIEEGCDGVEYVKGWIIFDFVSEPNLIVYDGVLEDGINFKEGKSNYGKFSMKDSVLSFNLLKAIEGKKYKSHLVKTSGYEEAKEKAEFYRTERVLMKDFIITFWKDAANQRFKKIASSAVYPLKTTFDVTYKNAKEFEEYLRHNFNEETFAGYSDVYEYASCFPTRRYVHDTQFKDKYMMMLPFINIDLKITGGRIRITGLTHLFG